MNKLSWRHHYIPQFYLNGFTSPSGGFKVFDVEKKQFIKSGKEFSPESYFFEKDGNSVMTPSGMDDFTENFFSKIDSMGAEIFNRMYKSSVKDNFNISDYDVAKLQYFIGFMYWRIPANFDRLKTRLENCTLKQLGLLVKNEKNELIENSSFEKMWKNSVSFPVSMKFFLPNISFAEIFDCSTPLHIIPFREGLPSICSDNPIISIAPNTFRVYADDFIFPIDNSKILVRGSKLVGKRSITVKVELDIITYKQAQKYVSCTDERYIEMLDDLFENHYKDLDMLRAEVFGQILENEDTSK